VPVQPHYVQTTSPAESELLPWEKQRGESAKAFAAFQIYRDLGSRRSHIKVEEALKETRAAGPAMVRDWSTRWSWVERVDAYDREQDRKARLDHDQALSDARRTQAMAGTLALGAGLRRLRGDDSTEVQPLDLNELDARDVARLMETGAKLQLSGLGAAPDLRGKVMVSGEAVYELTRALLLIVLEHLDAGMRVAVDANGSVDDLIVRQQEALMEEAGLLYTRATRG